MLSVQLVLIAGGQMLILLSVVLLPVGLQKHPAYRKAIKFSAAMAHQSPRGDSWLRLFVPVQIKH